MLRSCLLIGILVTAGPILPWGGAAITDFLPDGGRHEFAQVHMGVRVRIVLHAEGEAPARAAASAAFERVAALDRMMSDYRDDSEVRAVERAAGAWATVSPELFDVLTRAVAIAEASGGAFDPAAGSLVALWREARRTGQRPSPAALDEARKRAGWRRVGLDPDRRAVRVEPGVRLDLGGIAKGYILQAALATLASHGVSRALVEAGGDIVVGDAPPGRDGWRIEVAGADPSFTARARRLRHAALATSGPGAQHVEIDGVRYSHVLDPRTGLALTSPLTAHVIAADGATADALATALTVLPPEAAPALLARFSAFALRATADEPAASGPAPPPSVPRTPSVGSRT